MKVTIDTEKKTIQFHEKITVGDLKNQLNSLAAINFHDYTLELSPANVYTGYRDPFTPSIKPYGNPPWPTTDSVMYSADGKTKTSRNLDDH